MGAEQGIGGRFAARLSRRLIVPVLLTIMVGIVVTEACTRTGISLRLDIAWSDAWHRLSGVRHVPERVAIVALDEQTLAQYREVPLSFWTPLFARTAQALRKAGARVIAFDFLFTFSPESWLGNLPLSDSGAARTFDLAFRQQLNAGQIVVAGSRIPGDDGDDFLLPTPDYLLALPAYDIPGHVGLVDLLSGEDGVVREFQALPRVKPAPGIERDEAPRWSLPALVARSMGAPREQVDDEAVRMIGFAGPPGTIPRVSMRRLLESESIDGELVRLLKGKAVFVGAVYPGMNDVHVTPYGSGLSGRLMPGVEIQANTAETILSGKGPEPVHWLVRCLIALAILVPGALFLSALSPLGGLAVLVVLFATAAGAGWSLFEFGNLVFPVGSLQIGLLSGFLVLGAMRLTGEERERRRVGAMFGRYVSPAVVRELMDSARLPELGGASREISILFSDIRGFTTYSEQLSAHEIVEMLNNYFERACGAILSHGGTIDKFIGDAIMAEFGTPIAQEDHARRALKAALALADVALEFRQWMARRFEGRELHEFSIGIGVHSGQAVVGNIGSSQKMEFTAIGDTVNVASRLEGVTKDLGCVIAASKITVEAASPGVLSGRIVPMRVKGREIPVEVHEILGLKED